MRQIGALLVESMPQGTGNWTKSRQVADVQCPVTFVKTCNINALDKDAEDAGPATQTVATYWEPWRWGRYYSTRPRHTGRRVTILCYRALGPLSASDVSRIGVGRRWMLGFGA